MELKDFNKELRLKLKEILKPYGFRNKGDIFRCMQDNGITWELEIQRKESKANKMFMFTVNLYIGLRVAQKPVDIWNVGISESYRVVGHLGNENNERWDQQKWYDLTYLLNPHLKEQIKDGKYPFSFKDYGKEWQTKQIPIQTFEEIIAEVCDLVDRKAVPLYLSVRTFDGYLRLLELQIIERTLYKALKDKEIIDVVKTQPQSNEEALVSFLAAKKIEGCSSRSIAFYQTTLQKMFAHITKIYYSVTTEDIRLYLSNYQDTNKVSKSTIDNMRRIISSFFSWLESEDYIVKSPARRIHKVKTPKLVKEVFSDESIELMRQNCKNPRDLAIIDLLYSTGIRVGELVRLDISDVDFSNKECIVFGKGDKQRKVYFDAKTKIHLQQYIETRKDNNPALFVSLLYPYNRLKVSGVEIALRKIGEHLEIGNVHPHKFRRTLATKAIDKGMPIEQVQHLLGHAKIDTTLEYAMVDDENVKISHKKYLG